MNKIFSYFINKYFSLHTQFASYLLVPIGFLMITVYIYFRFIRARLPQDVPLHLTELRFYSLVFLCSVYIYVIYKYFFPPKTISLLIIKVIQFCQYLFMPLKALDMKIKSNTFIQRHFNAILDKHILYLKEWAYKKPGYTYLKVFYISFTIMPYIILLSILITDILYFHKIKYFYYFMPLGILPLLHAYLKYSLNVVKESYIVQLEKTYIGVVLEDSTVDEYDYDEKLIKFTCKWTPENATKYHEKDMSIRDYISFSLQLRIQNYVNDTDIEYIIEPYIKKEVYEQYMKDNNITKITTKERKIIKEEFDIIIPKILGIDRFLHYYSMITVEEKMLNKIKVYIIIGYVLCWSYILFVSFPKITAWPLTLKVLEVLTLYISLIEPFSDTLLCV